ncbi:hypothetical protein ABEG63_16540 [Chryseobacterium sp. C39-AII1]|uniref:hypothetical protein n=1 Tax=Chryseobacterium sp. C39-AII1 TaxID=3080332 RepID=UPI003209E137
MRKIVIFFAVITNLLSCQKKDKQMNSTNERFTSNDTIELIKKHIDLQKMYELPENDTDISHQYHLTDIDYKLGGYVVAKGLVSSGFKPLGKDEFNNKIKLFFENSPNCKLTQKKGNGSFYTFLINTEKDTDIEKTEDDYTYDHIFVFPEYKIISSLPLLESFVKIENNKLDFIQDSNSLHRNNYLFNESKADLVWLLLNDKDFLQNLLVVFGYDKEEKINEMVLNDLFKKYESDTPVSTEKIGEILFVKDCNKKLSIREGLLDYVAKHTNQNESKFIEALGNYLLYLFHEDTNKKFDEDLRSKFTLEDKAKIVAYVANIESPAFYKYKYSNSTAGSWTKAGTSLYNITNEYPEILEIIKKNNYYGLQPLKEIIEGVEFEEEKNIGINFYENEYRKIKTLLNKQKASIAQIKIYDRADFNSFSTEITVKNEIEYLSKISGWDFIRVDGRVGYIPNEQVFHEVAKTERKKHSFLADDDPLPEKKKGFWDRLFG